MLGVLALLSYCPAFQTFASHYHLLALLVGAKAFSMAACPTASDILRARAEFLGPQLHHRASFMEPWLSIVPRSLWEKGTGFIKSSFKIQRSEAFTDEESWTQIQSLAVTAGTANPLTGQITYNQVYNGEREDTYVPEVIGLRGPVINQDALTHYWNSSKFWMSYFEALEKRNVKTVINRLANVYMNYCYKMAQNATFNYFTGGWQVQPSPQCVDLSALIPSPPSSQLTQDALDYTAIILNQEGADQGDTNGWVTRGPDGPIYTLLIGQEASNYLLKNNSELRSDFNQSFQGWKETNPVIQRLGASRVIKNFRHVVTNFPPRWALLALSGTVQYISTGSDGTTAANKMITATAAGSITVNPSGQPAGSYIGVTFSWSTGAGVPAQPTTGPYSSANLATTLPTVYVPCGGTGYCFLRIPSFANSISATDVTVGLAGVTNGAWNDPSVASYEACIVTNPLVMTEEIVEVQDSLPGAKLNPQNYFGEWDYVTGNDAVLGMDGCTGIADPKKKIGRHFAEYRHALDPIFPQFGRLIVYLRCSGSADQITCS